MKKIFLIVLCFISLNTFSQDDALKQDTDKHHEIKINIHGLTETNWANVSYEYLLNEESSLGVDVQIGFDDSDSNIFLGGHYRKISITPHFRKFFSSKYARGFYVEGFGMFHTSVDTYDVWVPNPIDPIILDRVRVQEDVNNIALGLALGGKFVFRNGIIIDATFGVGQNLTDTSTPEFILRGGIFVGYRF